MSAIDRRAFIAAASGVLATLPLAAAPTPATASGGKFRLSIFATSWGYQGRFTDYCARVKDAGYDGIELGWPGDPRYRDEVFEAIERHGLRAGFICIVLRPDGGHAEHLRRFTQVMQQACSHGSPRIAYLDCHSGRDYYDVEQNLRFVDAAREAAGTTLPLMHETHRSRMLYAPAVSRRYLEQLPDLRVALDLSHWCVVSESLLEDQADTVALAIERTDAISARIGHAQGPQVSDPRAPEWKEALAAHLAWWDAVVARKRAQGGALFMTPEFGPPDYMPTVPYTHAPVSDQWAINLWMQQQLRQRYGGAGA